MTAQNDIRRWLKEAINKNAKYLLLFVILCGNTKQIKKITRSLKINLMVNWYFAKKNIIFAQKL